MLQVSYRGDALYLPVISVSCNYETTSSWVFCSANGVLRTFAFDIGTAMSSMIPKKPPPWPAISEPLSYSTHELLQNLLVGPSPFASKSCSLPKPSLVGGFNPFEKYWSNWIISSSRGENKRYLKPPPRSK